MDTPEPTTAELTDTCCTCGYTWVHGKSGSHQCSTYLKAALEKCEARAVKAEAELAYLKSCGLTVGMMKESGKETRLVYVIERGSDFDDTEAINRLTDAEAERDALAAELATLKGSRVEWTEEERESIRRLKGPLKYQYWEGADVHDDLRRVLALIDRQNKGAT